MNARMDESTHESMNKPTKGYTKRQVKQQRKEQMNQYYSTIYIFSDSCFPIHCYVFTQTTYKHSEPHDRLRS